MGVGIKCVIGRTDSKWEAPWNGQIGPLLSATGTRESLARDEGIELSGASSCRAMCAMVSVTEFYSECNYSNMHG